MNPKTIISVTAVLILILVLVPGVWAGPTDSALNLGSSETGKMIESSSAAGQDSPASPSDPWNNEKIARVRIPFIENTGQIKDTTNVVYYASLFSGTVYAGKDGITYVFPKKSPNEGWVVRESFGNGAALVPVAGTPTQAKVSYFIGNDREDWHTDIPSYDEVSFGEIMKGIHLKVRAYGNNVEKLFTIYPESNPSALIIHVHGAKGLALSENGGLRIRTGAGTVEMTKPVAYQMIDDKKMPVDVAYTINGVDMYGFSTGSYDPSIPLVIDPLIASTFLGSSGFSEITWGVVVNSTGYVYVAGYTDTPTFPIIPGAYQGTYGSGTSYNGVISQFDNNLSTLLHSTFISGTGAGFTQIHTIARDGSDKIYVAGNTYNSNLDFPIVGGSACNANQDGFIAKFNNNLNNLEASTCLGGSVLGSEGIEAMNVSGSGTGSVVTVTGKTAASDFPTTIGAYNRTFIGTGDIFVSRFPYLLNSLTYSTFLEGGDPSREYVQGIAVDAGDNVYITGTTRNSNFPTTAGAYCQTYTEGGSSDQAFISKLSPDLSTLPASTLLGGSGNDQARAFMVSGSEVFVGGYTDSADFPTVAGCWRSTCTGCRGFLSAFPLTLSTLDYSTYTSQDAAVETLATDANGDVLIAGNTASNTYPYMSDGYQPANRGGYDVFIAKYDNTLHFMKAGTYLGGTGSETVPVRLAPFGNTVYVAGNTASSDFPATDFAFDRTFNGGGYDWFVSRLDSNLSAFYPVTGCTVITSPGPYKLMNNIVNSAATKCINIQSSDVTFDGNDHTIDGTDTASSYGITTDLSGLQNISVRNVTLTDWYQGVYFGNVNTGRIENTTAGSNSLGIYVSSGRGIDLRDNNASDNSNNGLNVVSSLDIKVTHNSAAGNPQYGIMFEGGNSAITNNTISGTTYMSILLMGANNTVRNNSITGSGTWGGILLFDTGAQFNTISENIITNHSHAVYIDRASNNTIDNNYFNNSQSVYFYTPIYPNFWNSTKIPGFLNIIGGSTLGGNFWINSSGTGFSQTCTDGNGDGICDSAYTLAPGNIDNFPLTNNAPPVPAPAAAFHGTPPLSGTAPLSVSFTDDSTGSPTGWAWFFGDEDYTNSWTEQNVSSGWTRREYHSSVAMPDGSIVLMGGERATDLNDTWRSTDNGVTWTLRNASSGWLARGAHTSVAMPDGSIVLMGGSNFDTSTFLNDTWRSTDNGASWTLRNASSGWRPREYHSSVAMPDGSIVLMGGSVYGVGESNDTWRSTDNGATWTLMNASSEWGARDYFSSVAMPDGSIVLMGGNVNGIGYVNDAWRSTDNGATWTLRNANSGWSARGYHSSVAMPDGSIVLMGGYDGIVRNDTWRSTDNGATWTQLPDARWTNRSAFSSVAMRDSSIVLTGGAQNGGPFLTNNETWRFNPVGSSAPSPSHTYTTAGTYQVALQVFNTGGYNSTRKAGYITVTGAPTTGSIAVSSSPAGASIWVDDNPVAGLTPQTVTGQNPGYHHVRVNLATYYQQEMSVKVEGGSTATASFTMDPVLGSPLGNISVDSVPHGAKIYLDESDTGFATPYTLPGLLGAHVVKITRPTYFNASRQVDVAGGANVTVNITMDAIPSGYDPVVIEAINKTLKEELDDDTSTTAVSAPTTPLAASVSLSQWGENPSIPSPATRASVVFIDEYPGANWAHNCSYVFIDTNGRKTVVKARTPSLDLVMDQVAGNTTDPRGANQNNINAVGTASTGGGIANLSLVPACRSSDCSNNYALLIDGGYNKTMNHIRYWNDISLMYQTLNKTYGYPRDHITVLMSDGTSSGIDRHNATTTDKKELYDNSPVSFDNNMYGPQSEVTDNATYVSVKSYLTKLKNIPGIATKDIFIFTTGHGDWNGKESILYLWNQGSINATEFNASLPTTARSITVVMEQCNSGGFVDKFIPTNYARAEKRMIATAAAYNQPSYDNGFSSTWTMAAARIRVVNNDQMVTDLAADNPGVGGNGDGNVSIWEATNYAQRFDPYRDLETPQYKDYPLPAPTTGRSQYLNLCKLPALATLTLTSPSGVDTWYMGYKRNITWAGTGLGSTTVNISLWNSTWHEDLQTNIPAAQGTFSWNIPRKYANATTYYVNITSTSPVLASRKSVKLNSYAAQGWFNINTTPNQATISIDGMSGLKTNQSYVYVSPGTHMVGLSRAGNQSVEGLYIVIPTKPKNISIVLAPLPNNGIIGSVGITSSPVSAEVILNGAGTGMMTPYNADLAPGTYTVTVRAEGYITPASRPLTISPDQPASMEFTLTPSDPHRAVFRSVSSGNNWIFDTNMDGVIDTQNRFGQVGDIPLVGDFNRDGVMDRAVFRGVTKGNNWIFDTNMDGVIDTQNRFGQIGDIPVVGDFNNDGVMDRAVFRGVTSGNNWLFDYSMDGTIDMKDRFGKIGDLPVVGDFNRDGVMDRAVFRGLTSGNNWLIDYNMDATIDIQNKFGKAGDIPLVGDFNKDGVMDRAVFRGVTSGNNWLFDYSMDGTIDTQNKFGKAGDIPVVWNL